MSAEGLSGRPTRAEIRLGALRRNFGRARELAGKGVRLMAVVKADAYGHGMLRVARELLAEGADYLGVAIVEEAVELRASGIEAPILVLGSSPDDSLGLFAAYGIDLALPSAAKARAASAAALAAGKDIRVHLKIDTGMGRIGVDWRSIEAFAEEIQALPGLDIVGAFSHLATADGDLDYAREQESRFRAALAGLAKKGIEPPIAHLANSAALVSMPQARFGMVRPGILVYGYEPSPLRSLGLEPVMRLVSRLSFVKEVEAGEAISYGSTWRAPEATTIATVPLGYGDGYSRALSNKASMWAGGAARPVRGRICMDQAMLDLGPGSKAREGDEVIVFGFRGRQGISGEELCGILGTIPYELTCMVLPRVPRVYVED
jgi:alanine racemase